ncbi:MAG: hypothetical protein MZV63_21515 [Marinilabiliales bacterium]|nr:hypothetical protein [Marinilabiliales bacterium]
MSILKGAAASALYGSRAADGVVVITTKKGSEGPVKVDFSSKYSYSWTGILPEQQGVYGRGFYNQAGAFSDYTTSSWGKEIYRYTSTITYGTFFQGRKRVRQQPEHFRRKQEQQLLPVRFQFDSDRSCSLDRL